MYRNKLYMFGNMIYELLNSFIRNLEENILAIDSNF